MRKKLAWPSPSVISACVVCTLQPLRRGFALQCFSLGLSVCVCVCVCLSVKSHLTYGASVRPENAVTYSAGNEGQNICGVFSETAPFRDPALPPLYGHAYSQPFFNTYFSCTRMRILVYIRA